MDAQQTAGRVTARQERPRDLAAKPSRSRARRFAVPLILLVAIAAVTFLIWKIFFAESGPPENVITLSGRIEGDDSAVAPKTTGRILEVRFREGDNVKAGETIAILDDEQVRAREDQARAALQQAEARANSAREQIAVLQEQLRQNQLEVEQARIDAQGRVRQAESELAAAQAELPIPHSRRFVSKTSGSATALLNPFAESILK